MYVYITILYRFCKIIPCKESRSTTKPDLVTSYLIMNKSSGITATCTYPNRLECLKKNV